jgi:hypothetical protein
MARQTMRRLTPAQMAMMWILHDTGSTRSHLSGRSELGGAEKTLASLVRAGCLVWSPKQGRYSLTAAGREAMQP